MNKILKYFMMVVVAIAGMSLSSCSDSDDNYSVGEFSKGAYLYADATDVVFGPSDVQTFAIKVGRTDASEAQTINLTCDNDLFTAPNSVTFKAGEKDVTVPVSCNLDLGQSEDVNFIIPTDKSSVYGDDTISMSITRDYTWEKIGTAEFADGLYNLSATVDVMKAKEYESTTADGTAICYYKFATPMATAFKQAGEEELPGGVDFKFYMDAKGNLQPLADGFYDIEKGTSLIGYQFYYNTSRYSDYCSFINENGTFTFTSFVTPDGSNLYGPITWAFEWKDGYPVKVSGDSSESTSENEAE